MRAGVLFGQGREQAFPDGFDLEAHVLEDLGVPLAGFDIEDLVHGDHHRILDGLPRRRHRWLYCGWMLPHEDYTALHELLRDRGDDLVVHPDSFETAAYLPCWYDLLADHTPETIWTETEDPEEAWELALDALGPPPWILKDHLKSARQWWEKACFVPEGADLERFTSICEGLLEFHADRFQRGFVVRRFVRLARLPYATPGHPVFDEHRVVFWNGEPVAHAPYHDIDVDPLEAVPFPWLSQVSSTT
ncbi:MAG: ATP-grasp domain-containing protein, partial [Myxococcales bacterium]|nr:ATP-grasp domain-containing protein [Myxococcales bacterium]